MTLLLQNAEQTRLRVLKLITKEKSSRQQRHLSDLMSPSPNDLLLHWTTGPWSYECDYRGLCKQDGSQLGPYGVTLAYISSYEEGPGALEVGWSWGDNVTRYLRAIVRLSCIMEPRTMEAAESFLLCSGREKKKAELPAHQARQGRWGQGAGSGNHLHSSECWRIWKIFIYKDTIEHRHNSGFQSFFRRERKDLLWLTLWAEKRGIIEN